MLRVSLPSALVIVATASVATASVSCGPAPDEACRAGFTRAADGHCYPPPPDPEAPTAGDVLLESGPCVPRKDGAEIDPIGGCIEGACAGGQWAAVDEALGGGAACTRSSSGATWVCVWPQQVEVQFPAVEADVSQPAAAAYSTLVRARIAYQGASPDGLGVGVAPRCWVDAFGLPDTAVFWDAGGALAASELVWDRYGIEIEDQVRLATGQGLPDGLVDEITLTGPP